MKHNYDEAIAKHRQQIKAIEAKKRKAARDAYKRKEQQACKLFLQGLHMGLYYDGNVDTAISKMSNHINRGIDNNDAHNASPQTYPQN